MLVKKDSLAVRKLYSKEVKQVFAALSYNVRFVGGAVRDVLLQKKVRDIDLATPFTPEKVTGLLERNKIKALPTGIQHGTITAVLGKKTFQITTLRNDEACDGRHAKVSFTDDWREDAARRDFTLNAMSLDYEGNLYDYFGGMSDALKGIVRFIGDADARVKEDYLRILRFFRFHSYYGKSKPDAASLKACVLHKAGLDKLSSERIQEELMKILASPNVYYVLSLMQKNNILAKIIPGNINLKYLPTFIELQNEKIHNIGTSNSHQRLACLLSLSLLERAEFNEFIKRLKFSAKVKEELESLVFPSARISSDMKSLELKKAIKKLGKETFTNIILTRFAEEITEKKSKKIALVKKLNAILKFIKDYKIPKFPVTGSDLLSLGIPQGKEVGVMLKKLEAWWEEAEYKKSKKEILARAKALYGHTL